MRNGIGREFFCPRDRRGYLACNREFAASVQGMWCTLCHVHLLSQVVFSATDTKLLPWQTGGGSLGLWQCSHMDLHQEERGPADVLGLASTEWGNTSTQRRNRWNNISMKSNKDKHYSIFFWFFPRFLWCACCSVVLGAVLKDFCNILFFQCGWIYFHIVLNVSF